MSTSPSSHDHEPIVIVLEDEQGLADLYTTWLSDDYTVRTAYTVQEGREKFDEAVDIALIDRRLPDGSGDEFLEWVQQQHSACRTAMVTAVNPQFDILDMPFDDYLVKPIDQVDLKNTVQELNRQREYNDDVRELYSLMTKKTQLETELSQSELDASEEYQELTERIEEIQESARATTTEFDDADFNALLQQIEEDPT
ncbi:HalX domain-containing protein [Salarchaeum sp. JOR-1]|uniref:HalX domain-containing protein n=1 Tax=Salarchaeum sp. JOR-1 TaxID=2599399 RepID=UPI001198C073|nr:HalX domain-containing protein [Salarchaeum sp. JOR-1]QDX40515.1 response regulator transcription factor [Salarchaeum sp. JOR-1]